MATDRQKELGTLVVVVLKARNLRDNHSIGKQDPYAIIRLANTSQRTKIDKRGGQHPLWDEEFRIPVSKKSNKDSRTLKVQCWSEEGREDEIVGEGEVDISETLRTGEFDDWVKIEENGSYRGEVYLEMTFFAAGPAPQQPSSLQRRPSKLPAAERLWRPPNSESPKHSPNSSPGRSPALQPSTLPPAGTKPLGGRNGSPGRKPNVSQAGNHLAPPPHRDVALPPLPEDPRRLAPYPNPGANLTAVPSVLRPRNPKSSPTPIPEAQQSRASSLPIPIPEPQPQPYYPQYQNQQQPTYGGYGGASQPQGGYSTSPPRGGYSTSPPRGGYAPPLPPRTINTPNPYDDVRYNSPHPHPQPLSNAVLPDPYAVADARAREAERQRLSRASQEMADEEMARVIARNEGIDVERLRAVEADEELARRLARELNEGAGDDRPLPIPGGW
ncbi:hypothetical protein BD410DRAFT_776149 [Rickenella mellea]|uniref:C2 domain-containing protein n=1 Tax=Rickenella mellea TaxID=50990 RepID=A0A4Y7PR71_9AGAM|nr:hypothetical protein BD410DRAFT_776149 [Rickenella mellea]